MYFTHISIGGGIVGIETTISVFNNICFNLKNKKKRLKFKGKKFSFAIIDTKPQNIPGGVAYGFEASQYGYFNNPIRLSPDNLKKWISKKNNKKKIITYLKKHGGFTGKEWLKKNLGILNSSKKNQFMELYFPRVLANFWMEEKLLLLLKKMKKASKKFSVFFEIKFIKGEVISINAREKNITKIFFKKNKYKILKLKINQNYLKKINFSNIGIYQTGSIYSITQSISLGLPPPRELATPKAQHHKNYIRDFYYSGATANLVKKIMPLIKKKAKRRFVIYFIGYKAGLLEPLSELKYIVKRFKISAEMICSSPNLLGIQKAQWSLKNKLFRLNMFKSKNLKKIKTGKKLFLYLLKEFQLAEKNGYNKYDAWTSILNKKILNRCIKNFSKSEKNLYKNNIFHKIRSITRFTYPATIEARDDLISSGILKARKENVQRVDLSKNGLFVYVKNFYNKKKKYLCDFVINVSGPLSAKNLRNEWPIINSIKKNNGKVISGGFAVKDSFELTNNRNIYLPGYLANGFNPERKTIIKAILENSNIAGKDIAKKVLSV
tara:strand:+ start:1754 stop:3403 length:1650 start_codon:yes stop_codon:yes gene_type:complete